MSSVGGISSYNLYGDIASGRMNSFSDGPAEMSIAEKQETQSRGHDAGSDNASKASSMLNVADGALNSITDSLQRMRELSIKAADGLTSDVQKQAIQSEIDQLKQGIADVANNTTFNTKNILDGSETDFALATDANGSTQTVTTANATLESLGIADYDVTGDFDISKLDSAIESVSMSRASMGAQTNALEYTIDYNNTAALNSIGSRANLDDLDIAEAVSEQKKREVLDTYQIMMQKRQQEEEQNNSTRLFQGI